MHQNCILKLKRKFGILTALPKNQFGILMAPEKMQFGAFRAYWFGQTKKVEFGETKAPLTNVFHIYMFVQTIKVFCLLVHKCAPIQYLS